MMKCRVALFIHYYDYFLDKFAIIFRFYEAGARHSLLTGSWSATVGSVPHDDVPTLTIDWPSANCRRPARTAAVAFIHQIHFYFTSVILLGSITFFFFFSLSHTQSPSRSLSLRLTRTAQRGPRFARHQGIRDWWNNFPALPPPSSARHCVSSSQEFKKLPRVHRLRHFCFFFFLSLAF